MGKVDNEASFGIQVKQYADKTTVTVNWGSKHQPSVMEMPAGTTRSQAVGAIIDRLRGTENPTPRRN